jgi:cell wall-associated NlpC family hydrolase
MHRRLRAGFAVAAFALVPAVDAAAAPYGSRPLREGTTGSDVKALQSYLDDAGFDTTADGEYGPATASSMRSFETAEQRTPNGVASRSDQQLVRSRAGEAVPIEDTPAPIAEEATLDDTGVAVAPASAPPEVQAIIAAGNEIATKPYKYGGGHGRWKDRGYDCSGSISYVLHAAGLLDSALDSSGFMKWGERGVGQWVTIYTNPGHAYLVVGNLRFDTSARRETGSRWTETERSSRGYRIRHPEGL